MPKQKLEKKEITRNTIQRMRILEYLKSVHTHPTAEQIYKAVIKKLPTITLATVYRNLNLLADRGEILRLELCGEYHYDADTSFHQHGHCKNCHGIEDFFQKEISRYALGKLSSKFKAEQVDITYEGLCAKCGCTF